MPISNNSPDSISDRALGAWNQFWFAPRDPIVLAVMRIATGLVALGWLISYTPDLERFFGPNGLVPVTVLQQWRGSTIPHSLLEFADSSTAIWLFHGISIAVLAMFTIGLFTRVTSWLALVCVVSYIHRLPFVVTPTEPVLLMLLAYLAVGPSGAALSIDRRLAARKVGATKHVRWTWAATVATRLIQVHLTLAYGAMALAKANDGVPTGDGSYHAWWTGEAVWWLAARANAPLMNVTGALTNLPLLVNAWTLAILAFELAFPIFVWQPGLRRFMLLLAIPMWLSLAIITGLAPFCLLMLIGNLAFLQPAEARRVLGRNAA